MTAPPIVEGLSLAAVVPLLLAAGTAWFFWTKVVPRQLQGLQVAFETGALRYEVHKSPAASRKQERCFNHQACVLA